MSCYLLYIRQGDPNGVFLYIYKKNVMRMSSNLLIVYLFFEQLQMHLEKMKQKQRESEKEKYIISFDRAWRGKTRSINIELSPFYLTQKRLILLCAQNARLHFI